jgi:actin
MKEKLGYVALNYDQEVSEELKYELPDGQTVTIGNERFRCTEGLFNPAIYGQESLGLHQIVYSTIMKSSIDMRRVIFFSS